MLRSRAEAKTEWAHALAGGHSVWGVEGSNGRRPFVPATVGIDNLFITKTIYYVVNIFNHSGHIAHCRVGLF